VLSCGSQLHVRVLPQSGVWVCRIYWGLRIAANSQYPVLLVVEELDIYLKPESKSQILNVLDGFESPNNPHGVLLIATTNYPEIIDERIAKRPGRVDRIIYIPEIQDEEQALRMLKHYMAMHWQEEHSTVAENLLGTQGHLFVKWQFMPEC
jgi:hypothetical protein